MKRIILLMLAIASMTAGNSQTNNDAKKLVSNSWFWFKEYKHHFINMKDSTDFVVVPMEGYTKKDLFQKMMLGLNDVYNDINKVVSTVGEDAITVNAYHEIKKSPFKIGAEFYYITGFQCRFSFKFKDGRLRVEAPQVSTFDYHHFLNENSKRQGKFADYDGLSGICVGVYDTIQRIIDASYGANKSDDW